MSNLDILEIIEFTEDCTYKKFHEFLNDQDNLFNQTQKLKLSCIKNLMLELQKESKEKEYETR